MFELETSLAQTARAAYRRVWTQASEKLFNDYESGRAKKWHEDRRKKLMQQNAKNWDGLNPEVGWTKVVIADLREQFIGNDADAGAGVQNQRREDIFGIFDRVLEKRGTKKTPGLVRDFSRGIVVPLIDSCVATPKQQFAQRFLAAQGVSDTSPRTAPGLARLDRAAKDLKDECILRSDTEADELAEEQLHTARRSDKAARLGAPKGSSKTPSSTTPLNAEKEDTGKKQKGNTELLAGHKAVIRGTAQKYLGVGERHVQKLVKTGALETEGKGQNKRITTASLRQYQPPKENPN